MKICDRCGTLNVKATNVYMQRCMACNGKLPAADVVRAAPQGVDVEGIAYTGGDSAGAVDLAPGCYRTLPTRNYDT